MNVVITNEDFLADRQGRTFADVATNSSRPFVAALEFFNDGDRQRCMEESEIHHDRAPLAGVVRELESLPAINRFLGRIHPRRSQRALPAREPLPRRPVRSRHGRRRGGEALDAKAASELGLVTFSFDDIDWDDEVRIFLEERASFSPDALTGLEANLRFAGPETMETKIFARLSAWQNWIFQRPNAVGEEGALKRYGTGLHPARSISRRV